MEYRVMLILTFSDEGKARGLFNHAKGLIPSASPLPDDYLSWHKCYHDEVPPKPCEVIEEWHPSISPP